MSLPTSPSKAYKGKALLRIKEGQNENIDGYEKRKFLRCEKTNYVEDRCWKKVQCNICKKQSHI